MVTVRPFALRIEEFMFTEENAFFTYYFVLEWNSDTH